MVGHLITYTQPYYFWLVVMVLIGTGCVVAYAVRAHHAMCLLAAHEYRNVVVRAYSRPLFVVRLSLVVLTLLLLWIALLRPQYPLDDAQTHYEYGRDVVIAVDISRSMLVADHAEQTMRIDRARNIIQTLLGNVASERLALIAFSGSALTLCPLTKDSAAFRMFVDLLSPDILSGGGTTSIACALQEAISLFGQQGERSHKLLIIITDGEDFSPDLADVQKKAEDLGVHISVIGIGSESGGPIPCYNDKGEKTGYQRDQQGIVISRLNEPLLRTMTQRFHGLYLSSALSDEHITHKLLTWVRAREAERGAHYKLEGRGDLFMWCITAALMIVLITWI